MPHPLSLEIIDAERIKIATKTCWEKCKNMCFLRKLCIKYCRTKSIKKCKPGDKNERGNAARGGDADEERPDPIISPEAANGTATDANKAKGEKHNANAGENSLTKEQGGDDGKGGKRNKRRRKRGEADKPGVVRELEDNDNTLICKLCMREQPLYFYQQEDIIKRLPERTLTKLLTQMKIDLQAKLSYFKFLKVSAKFCQPCECPRKNVHTYCQTAQIIIN